MTYVFEITMGGKELVVEYVFSSVSDSIKVVDMTADGEFHRLNWMSEEGRNELMDMLEDDFVGRGITPSLEHGWVELPKNANKVMVGGNWPTEEPTEEDWLLGKLNIGEPEYLGDR